MGHDFQAIPTQVTSQASVFAEIGENAIIKIVERMA
jgi:hypothetical protein